MTDPSAASRDYRATLFLPDTPFPMRAGLPQKEPAWIQKWTEERLRDRQRAASAGRPRFVFHDGPPYANGHSHIGHALNNTLKDLACRTRQMVGFDVDFVPGWDCHGLPIEWKVEEAFRAEGRRKEDVPAAEFRAACRAYAGKWVDIQREERRRMGIMADWDAPYLTMDFEAEAVIAAEFLKVADTGLVYRGSKPVMWSPVERTSLAEAEVEYQEKTSPAVWVKFPIGLTGREGAVSDPNVVGAKVVIWTTTPWTIPANRAIAYSPDIAYGLYRVTALEEGLSFAPWTAPGEVLAIADSRAAEIKAAAKVAEWARIGDFNPSAGVVCRHPLSGYHGGYMFEVPLIPGEHVTEDAGTGFVHTAPGHGVDDYAAWLKSGRAQDEIPFILDADGRYTAEAPGFEGLCVLELEGKKAGKDGPANAAVIAALEAHGGLLARGRLVHQYPHSWRSKAPLIYRNTPQWFIAMDRPAAHLGGRTLRQTALDEIAKVDWGRTAGANRIRSMVETRPDWLVSRQRAWGVPLAMFVNRATGEILRDREVDSRILSAMRARGADAWFSDPPEAFLGPDRDPADYEKVDDILDVWFDSGCTHAFVLDVRPTLSRPADLYLEGGDQHRGWFQSSLLESCVTRGAAPYRQVRTHGMIVDEHGRKLSKSLGNGVELEDVLKQNGMEILRLVFASAEYSAELAIGRNVLDQAGETYRKLRNTLRYLLASLKDWDPAEAVAPRDMPLLERWLLDRMHGVDAEVRAAWTDFDFRRGLTALVDFANLDLSAFYVDVRKDALYCDPPGSPTRRACRTALDLVFDRLVAWLAPYLPFTAEEAWTTRVPDGDSVHLRVLPDTPAAWADPEVAARMAALRELRRVVTGALEIRRRDKAIGSSLEANPIVHLSAEAAGIRQATDGVDLAELCITSGLALVDGNGPPDAFRLDDAPGIAVEFRRAEGIKCARSWKYFDPATADPAYPDITPRDAAAVRAFDAANA